jgi:predicted phosphohydrolase
MPIYVLSDLHLSTAAANKSMEVFGPRWQDYISKIEKNWNAVVGKGDTVIVPGDISWATRLEESESDLRFLDSLNGYKLIGKGNHDFWWSTATKMNAFFKEKNINTISILYNNAYLIEDKIVCGTRGWFPEEAKQVTVGDVDYDKIVNRELTRLMLSLDEAHGLQQTYELEIGPKLPIIVFLHFPPVWGGLVMEDFIKLMKRYDVKECYFGHIHGGYVGSGRFKHEDIKFALTSSDFLNFYPLKI